MSDSVLMSQSPLASLLPLNSSAQTLVLKEVPPEILKLPVGTILSAQIVPAEGKNGTSVLNVSMPDGSVVVFETKTAFPDNINVAINFKITGLQGNDSLLIRINSKENPPTSLPNSLPLVKETFAVSPDTIISKQSVLNGHILKTIPPSIQKELPLFEPKQTLPEGTKISFHLAAEENLPTTSSTAVNAYTKAPVLENAPTGKTPAFIPETKSVPAPVSDNTPVQQPITQVKTEPTLSPSQQTPLPVSLPTNENPPEIVPTSSLPTNNGPVLTTNKASETPVEFQKTQQENHIKTPLSPLVEPETLKPSEQKATSLTSQPSAVVSPKPEQTAPVIENPLPNAKPATNQNVPAPTMPLTIEKENIPLEPLLKPDLIPNASPISTNKVPETITGVFIQPKSSEPAAIACHFGVLALNEKISLPHLSPLFLKVISLELPAEPMIRGENISNSPWAFLNDAIDSLRQNAPEAVDSLLAVLPKTGNKLPALMLSFMNVVNTGQDVRAWIGEANIQALQSMGKRGEAILKSFEKEFAQSVKKGTDGKSVWKGYDIPFMTGTAVEPVSLYLQQSSEALEERSKNKPHPTTAVRFVLDLNLTKLGRLQLEGLAQRADKTFHLNIRHIYPLDTDFEENIRTLFSKTLDALHYAGICSFKRTDDFIEIRPEKSAPSPLKNGVWA